MSLHPALLLKERYRLCWWVVFALLCVPAATLGWAAWQEALGPNPLERLERDTGRWALICLALALAITPARRALSFLMVVLRSPDGKRLSDWNALVRMRRMVGLVAFAYGAAHVLVYLELDVGWDGAALADAFREKPYILAGLAAFAALLPLAATSTDFAMRKLGRYWKRLHRLTYFAACAGCLHFVWLSKPGVLEPYPYVALILLLLAYRVILRLRPGFHPGRDGGDEVPERPSQVKRPESEELVTVRPPEPSPEKESIA